jgi:uncharacterized integral membrane protein
MLRPVSEPSPPQDEATDAAVVEKPPPTRAVEPRGERRRRHTRRARLYAWSVFLVAIVVLAIALAVENTRQVKLNWLAGSSRASLIWVVVVAGLLGWLLGIVTSVVFRLRTRRRPPA